MKVSVALIAYNHEKYIAQAIESVLMQKVNFDYEIIIGEDCSIDSPRDIVIDFHRRYPDKIRLILPQENLGLGGKKMYVETIQACRGQYVALLDGDDYWTCPDKLQKQVEFLDSHPECAICFHNVQKVYEEGNRKPQNQNPANQKEISNFEDLVQWDFIATCSTMYRRGLVDAIPDWFYTLLCGDWILHILNAQYGSIGYINQVMGVYRIHGGGLWSSLTKIQQSQELIKCYQTINSHLNFKYNEIMKTMISVNYYDLAVAYENEGDIANAKKYARKCIVERPFNKYILKRNLLKLFLRLYGKGLR